MSFNSGGLLDLGHGVIYDTTVHEVQREGRVIVLQNRQAALLNFFISHASQKLTRAEILESVWQGRVVNDEALSRAVAELRAALGDSTKVPRFIKTLPRVGYCFVAVVNAVDSERHVWRVYGALAAIVLGTLFLLLMKTSPERSVARVGDANIQTFDYLYGDQYFLGSSRDGQYALFASHISDAPQVKVVSLSKSGIVAQIPTLPGSQVSFGVDPYTLLVSRVFDGRCEVGEYSLLLDDYTQRSACPGQNVRVIGAVQLEQGTGYLGYRGSLAPTFEPNDSTTGVFFEPSTLPYVEFVGPYAINASNTQVAHFGTDSELNPLRPSMAFTSGELRIDDWPEIGGSPRKDLGHFHNVSGVIWTSEHEVLMTMMLSPHETKLLGVDTISGDLIDYGVHSGTFAFLSPAASPFSGIASRYSHDTDVTSLSIGSSERTCRQIPPDKLWQSAVAYSSPLDLLAVSTVIGDSTKITLYQELGDSLSFEIPGQVSAMQFTGVRDFLAVISFTEYGTRTILVESISGRLVEQFRTPFANSVAKTGHGIMVSSPSTVFDIDLTRTPSVRSYTNPGFHRLFTFGEEQTVGLQRKKTRGLYLLSATSTGLSFENDEAIYVPEVNESIEYVVPEGEDSFLVFSTFFGPGRGAAWRRVGTDKNLPLSRPTPMTFPFIVGTEGSAYDPDTNCLWRAAAPQIESDPITITLGRP